MIWIILFVLVIMSFVFNVLPDWVPIIAYLLLLGVKLNEVVGNYFDWERQNEKDEKEKLGLVAQDMANRGLTFSGFRAQEEEKVKNDFENKRRKEKRKFYTDLVNVLFLK